MTVRTRKTITDLIQQLKAQEKEIKSQLSDGQRRLNETRDRIATCYWVIEELEEGFDVGDYDPHDDECYRLSREEYQVWKTENPHLSEKQLEDVITQNGWLMPLSTCKVSEPEEMTNEEWEELVRTHPNLSGYELEKIVESQGFLIPSVYDGCPCPDCSWDRENLAKKVELKEKPKAKPLPKKKSKYQVVKKGSKYVVEKKPVKKTKKGKK